MTRKLPVWMVALVALFLGRARAEPPFARARARLQDLKARFHTRHEVPEVIPPPPTLSLPRVALAEEQMPVTLPRIQIHDKMVGYGQDLEVKYREERRKVIVWVSKPRQVEKEVVLMDLEPVTVTDPCTGQCHTHYRQVPKVRTMKVTVYEVVPETQEVIVNVPAGFTAAPFTVQKVTALPVSVPGVKTTLHPVVAPNEIALPPEPTCPGCGK
jgi:hypothetical protein